MKPAHLALLAFLVFAAPASGAPSGLKQEVLDLVRPRYHHGMPPARARELGPRAVPYLEKILNDPSGKPYWKNAAAATARSQSRHWDSLPWRPASGRHLAVVLSKLSINGLGWMGTRRSEEHLGALSKRPFHPQQRANIATALRRNREIRRLGREAYTRALGAEAERKQRAPSFDSSP